MTHELPWEYRDALGYNGLPIDEGVARAIVVTVGVHAHNRLGDTPLSTAAMLGRVAMVEWLLELGAEVDHMAPAGPRQTPLIVACYNKRLPVVRVLLDAGADIEAVDDYGNTPLANAFINCFADPFPIVELLLERGATITPRVRDLAREHDDARFTALVDALRRG